MSTESHEYGLREIFLTARKAWLFIVGAMVAAAALSGYWSYTKASGDTELVQVHSVVSLPAVDFALIDMQTLFAQSLVTSGPSARPFEASKTTLTAVRVGTDEGGRRAIVDLTVQSPSPELAAASLSRLLIDLGARVRAQHPVVETGQSAELTNRINEAQALIQDLRTQQKSSDPVTEALRQLTLANSLASLAALELASSQLRLSSAPDLRVELPSGRPIPAGASGLRWIRMPLVITLAAGLFVLLAALLIDAVPRIVARK